MRSRLHRILNEPMWVLGLVIFVDEADKNIIRGLVTPLREDLGVNDLGIAILLTTALLFNGLITVPAGYLADRWHRTRAIGLTVIGWSFLTAAGALSIGFPMLVAMRSALGFGQAITEPSAASLVGDYYPTEVRGKAFSVQYMTLFAGTGFGVAWGGFIGNTLGWRWALVTVAIPGLFVAALVYRLREPKRGSADLMSALGAAPPDVGDADDADADDHQPLFGEGFGAFLREMWDGLKADMRTIMNIRTMRYALVGVAAILFTIAATAAWLPQFYERQLGLEEGYGEAWVGLVALAGVPGVLLGGRAADRWIHKIEGGRLALPAIFLFVGLALTCVGYVIRPGTGETGPMGYSPGIFLVILACQFFGFGTVTMSIPGLRAGLTDTVPAHLRGTGFGAFNLMAVVGGMALGPFAVGGLSAAFDENLRTAFLLVAPVSFFGAAVLFRARKFLNEDMQKMMMVVLQAIQEEKERHEAADAEPEAEATPVSVETAVEAD